MMLKYLAALSVLEVIIYSFQLTTDEDVFLSFPTGAVLILISDNQKYMSLCTNCGNGTLPDSLFLSSTPEKWTLEKVGNKIALRGKNGKLLSRCHRCWKTGEAYHDSAFVQYTEHEPYSLWTPILQPNGKYVFRSDNGKYLTRCNGCVDQNSSPDFVFVHEENLSNPWAQWEVIQSSLPKFDDLTFQADNGKFLKYCPTCGSNNALIINADNDDNAKWTIQRVGDKVTISQAKGGYLIRGNGAESKKDYDKAVLTNQNYLDEPYFKWTPIKLQNGKWVFQSDNGKYLIRGNFANSNSPNLAFVHKANPQDPWSQWKLI